MQFLLQFPLQKADFPGKPGPAVLLALLLLPTGVSASPLSPENIQSDTRSCVRSAANTGQIIGCELQAGSQWLELVGVYAKQVEQQLPAEARRVFQQSQQAWQAFVEAETRLLKETFASRADGMGRPMLEGARNTLLRERALQLRAHLGSLKQAR